MRFRPANIRLINRRSKLLRLLLALSSGKENANHQNNPTDLAQLTRSLHIRPMCSSNHPDGSMSSASGRKTGYSEPWYQQNPSDDEPGQLYEMPTIRTCAPGLNERVGDYAQTEIATYYSGSPTTFDTIR